MKCSKIIIAAYFSLILSTAFSQDTLVLQPGMEGKDSFLDDWYTEPHGDYPNLFALAGTSNGMPCMMRSIVEFDISSIPEGSVVLDARLSLYFANNPSVPHYQYGDNVALLQRVIEPWDEAVVNWFNQPAVTEENQVVLPASTDPEQDYLDIDVRDLFQDIVNDPENSHGFLFRLQTEEMYRRMFFASSDYDDPAKWPKLVIIYDTCTPPHSDFTYSAEELDIFFHDSSDLADIYYWDFGDGYYSDLSNPWHHYQEEGTYEVCLTTWNECYSNTMCQWIEVCEKPVSSFTFTIEGNTAFFEDQSEKAESYYWSFGDGYYSDLQDPIHIYDTEENFQVCLITYNECGSDTICQMLYIYAVSIPENKQGNLIIYPNPAKDEVFITASQSGLAEIRLLDLSGKEVLKMNKELTTGEIMQIGLDGLNPGIYIVRIDSALSHSFGKLAIIK